ncbi:hypothetical protein GCM10010358_75440 [Streptomyces minutiscleroticus]|uniref:Uncharacterized protein n=1 Tax=Streptomyces minutiscleroticus TaxID=68238 RepID=A0A918P0R0_9ACTN|nr:hypothetical protein GCM10010358_75440 [Streptomyces minutiscleroticus]
MLYGEEEPGETTEMPEGADAPTSPSDDVREEPQTSTTTSVPSPRTSLRDRTNWTTLVVLPLLGAIAFWAVQSLWGWAWDKVSGPPGLTAYTSGPTSCTPATLPLVLQAKTDQAIVVTGVEVTILPDTAPAQDEGKPSSGNCTGTVHEPVFDADLAQTPVPVVPVEKNPEPDRTDFPFTVAADSPKQLTLQLQPGKPDARFFLKVEWVADGEYGSVILDNDDDSRTNDGPGYRGAG